MANRLRDWPMEQQRITIRAGFKLAAAHIHGSLYFPVDLLELVIDFAVDIQI